MQLDLFDMLNAEQAQDDRMAKEAKFQQTIAEQRAALGWNEYERLKAKHAIAADLDSLPWTLSYPNMRTSNFEHCDLKVIIPPDALTSMEYDTRFPDKSGKRFARNPVMDACHEKWALYNQGIWKYNQHGVDWCGAMKLLSEYRDEGKPIWIRHIRVGGRTLSNFLPECIVEMG